MRENNDFNIMILSFDNVRADHLPFYGYKRNITPNINKLIEESIIFKNAFSTSSWTLPAFASLFTGKVPSHHQLLIPAPNFQNSFHEYLNGPTITQYLKLLNYETFGIIPTPVLRKSIGFEKGFIEYKECWRPPLEKIKTKRYDLLFLKSTIRNLFYGYDKNTYYINEKIKQFIKKQIHNKQKFFIFTNFFNAHAVWSAPRKFRAQFEIKPPKSNKKIRELLKTSTFFFELKRRFVKTPWEYMNIFYYMTGKMNLTPFDLQILKSKYDAEIAYLDAIVGNLIKFLKEKGVYNNTLIIIFSDHGESFGEHKLLFHAFHLYDHLIHIPLIMKLPFKTEIHEYNGLVSLVDIFPTILALLNKKIKHKIDGISLFPFEKTNGSEYIFAELGWCRQNIINIFRNLDPNNDYSSIILPKQCVRTKKYKLIRYYNGKEELFDLERDFNEKENVINKNLDEHKKLSQILDENLTSYDMQKEKVKIKRHISKLNL